MFGLDKILQLFKRVVISSKSHDDVLKFTVEVPEAIALLTGNQMDMLPVMVCYPLVV